MEDTSHKWCVPCLFNRDTWYPISTWVVSSVSSLQVWFKVFWQGMNCLQTTRIIFYKLYKINLFKWHYISQIWQKIYHFEPTLETKLSCAQKLEIQAIIGSCCLVHLWCMWNSYFAMRNACLRSLSHSIMIRSWPGHKNLTSNVNHWGITFYKLSKINLFKWH